MTHQNKLELKPVDHPFVRNTLPMGELDVTCLSFVLKLHGYEITSEGGSRRYFWLPPKSDKSSIYAILHNFRVVSFGCGYRYKVLFRF